jgi:hypothetical protein
VKTLSSKKVYECPIFKVEERKVLLDTGEEVTRWVLVKFPNVTVIGLTNDKKLVLIHEKRGYEGQVTLELPGGKTRNTKSPKKKQKHRRF